MGQVYKNAGIEAARIAGRDPIMARAGAATKIAVLAAIAPHNKTAHLSSSIQEREVAGRSGVRDRLVYSTDPNVMQIEYGHMLVLPSGPTGKWVPGLRLFSKAFNAMKRTKVV